MRSVPADKILSLQEEHQLGANVRGLRLPPTLDGLFWTADKHEMLVSRAYSDVPMIVGSNGDDLDSVLSPLSAASTVKEFQGIARKMYGPDAEEFLHHFPVSRDADVVYVAREASRERGMLASSQTCAFAPR
jgi:para-nitrobenzyl esterase